jgi:uncharacterized membrane protein YeaQ/YmgE (transglycosylase-associated protein family)
MTIEQILITAVIGGVIGWLASIVMKTNAQMGILMNVLVGVGGAFVGRWLAGVLNISAGGGLGPYLIAFGGAVVLIIALRFFKILK